MELILPRGLQNTAIVQELNSINKTANKVPIKHLTLAEIEKKYIIEALDLYKKHKAAEILGITLRTLYTKIHQYGLWDKYRDRPETPAADLKNEVNFKNGNWDRLTRKQVAIALLVLKDLNNKQIADEVGLSKNSVNKYISIMYRLTHVSTRYEFIVKFSKTGQ